MLGGLGLIHPGFLAAGLAVAVPIAIHLLLRQKARQVEIGSLHFLRVVLRDQAHRRKLCRWILLALRVAGVGLLAALFARPYWSASESAADGHAVIVLIDRSASMGAGKKGKTPWDLARERAREITRAVPAGAASTWRISTRMALSPCPPATWTAAAPSASRPRTMGRRLAWARDLAASPPASPNPWYIW